MRVKCLSSDVFVTYLLAAHEQVAHQVIKQLRLVRGADHLGKVLGVVGLDVRIDGLLHHAGLELCLRELRVDLRLVAVRSERGGALQGLKRKRKYMNIFASSYIEYSSQDYYEYSHISYSK